MKSPPKGAPDSNDFSTAPAQETEWLSAINTKPAADFHTMSWALVAAVFALHGGVGGIGQLLALTIKVFPLMRLDFQLSPRFCEGFFFSLDNLWKTICTASTDSIFKDLAARAAIQKFAGHSKSPISRGNLLTTGR